MLPIINREPWQDDAACRDLEPEDADRLFFSDHGGPYSFPAEGRRMCQRCPVSAQCLEFALRTGQEYGVWGGLPARGGVA